MDKKEQQRLAELQRESLLNPNYRSDLLLLLRADPEVQACIRQLVSSVDIAPSVSFPLSEYTQEIGEPSKHSHLGIIQFSAPALPVPKENGLHAVLAPELELLAWIAQDSELDQTWLGSEDNGERRVVRLIAVAAQWDRLLLLWDRLATRCKEKAHPALLVERQILTRCLALHNLIWQGRQASLQEALPGENFDPLRHERGVLYGDRISAEWLPGLRNAAGQLQRKPLVGT